MPAYASVLSRWLLPLVAVAWLLAVALPGDLPLPGKKQLLFENRVHPWKIYYVQDRDFARGRFAYYEVHYRDQPLVLPKDLFGAAADIDRFFVAAGFPPEATDSDSVLLGFTPSLLLPGGSTNAGDLMFVYARSVGVDGREVQIYSQERRLLGVLTIED